MNQTVVIEWKTLDDMPEIEGNYLVAFDDGTVETFPISYREMVTGVIQDGNVRGILWANNIGHPHDFSD